MNMTKHFLRALTCLIATSWTLTATAVTSTPPDTTNNTTAAKAPVPPPVTLHVGDPAPRLQTGKYVQGDPVTGFAAGKAYIVEFWATWCGPCKASIPHLNAIYEKFKDQGLIVIGQDCWETDASKVAPFIASMGSNMTYRVALDDKTGSNQGKMSDTWMTAAGRNGIPTAFLVDTRGAIAWIGHPMELKESTIEAVLAGTYHAREAAAAEEKQQNDIARLKTEIQTSMKAKDWGQAATALDQLNQLAGADANLTQYVSLTHFQVYVGQRNFPAAFNEAAQLSDANPTNALMQNIVSLLLTTDDNIEHPDLDVALKASERAVALAADPVIKGLYLDTLARIQFMKGDKNAALTTEQQAVTLAEKNPSIQATLKRGLESYQSGELPLPTWKRMKPEPKK